MPREDVPYPGGRCSLRCEIANLWNALKTKLHSINGVQGDGNGDVKILAGQNVQIVNDQVQGEITISATAAAPQDVVKSVNGELPDSAGAVVIPVGTALVKKSITLTAAGWVNDAQTVSIAGLLSDDDVLVAADPANYDDWNAAGVRAVSQAAGSITFECTATPSMDLAGNVVIGRLGS